MKGVTVFGPARCGKTLNSDVIADHLGLRFIIEDGEATEPPTDPANPPADTLVLTNNPAVYGALDYFEIMQEINAEKK